MSRAIPYRPSGRPAATGLPVPAPASRPTCRNAVLECHGNAVFVTMNMCSGADGEIHPRRFAEGEIAMSAAADRPTRVRHIILWPDGAGLHGHLFRPGADLHRHAGDPEGVRLFHRDGGLDPVLLSRSPMRCSRFPAAGSATSSARARADQSSWCGGRRSPFFTGLSWSRHHADGLPLPDRHGRGGRLPQFHPCRCRAGCCRPNAARPGRHPCRLAAGRRVTPVLGGDPDRTFRLAHALLRVRGGRHGLGGRLVLVLSRQCPASMPASMKASAQMIVAALGAAPKAPADSVEADPVQPRRCGPWRRMYFCYGYAINMFLAWYPEISGRRARL